jgi:hypothetical protein
MKKIVLTFGLISGAIAAALMWLTIPFIDRIGLDKAAYVGSTGLLVSFLLVFFGIRSYRENVGNGAISFGRAFSVGILIALISALCYVASWQILSYTVMTDFAQTYSNYVIAQAKASGASAAEIEQTRQQMEHFSTLYNNPFYRAAFTFIEPWPVGLPVTLLSALILRKKLKASGDDQAAPEVTSATAPQT